MLDGYDLLVMGFAMPHLPEGFATSTQKGYLISAALAGMAVGAIGIGRLADTIGRRRVLLIGLAVNTVGLAASALSTSFETLLVTRFLTGIAIGTITVVIVVLCQEIVPPNRRSLALGLVMVGNPLGTMLAGFAGAGLVSMAGGAWQGMFWIGSALGVLSFVVTAAFLRESEEFFARKDPKAVADPTDAAPQEAIRLFGSELRSRTVFLVFGYTMLTAAYYFVGSWTPQLITDASGDAESGALAGIMIGFGAVVGASLFGAFGLRFRGARIAFVSSFVAAVAIAAFAVTLQGPFALAMAGLLGGGTFAAMAGYTSTSTSVYPVLARAKGYGTMLGVARGGGILAPILAGYALSVMTPRTMYLAVVVPLILAALAAIALTRITRAVEAEVSPMKTPMKT
ncbi:MFS transporter [Rhodococcus sp. NPDC127593]